MVYARLHDRTVAQDYYAAMAQIEKSLTVDTEIETIETSTPGERARLMPAGPAEAFGLERKGRIEAGYDADLTLVDPNADWTIGDAPLLTKCGWTPFAGRKVRGRVERVLLRGREVYAGGDAIATPGAGRGRPSV